MTGLRAVLSGNPGSISDRDMILIFSLNVKNGYGDRPNTCVLGVGHFTRGKATKALS